MKFAVLLAFAAGFAPGEIVDSSAGGFTIRTVLTIKAAPDEVYQKLIHNVGDWWNPQHTFSGDAHNLRIEDRPGGCLCEKLPNNGFVRHLEVVYLAPGKAITLSGGLGPMQAMAATGSMQIQLAPVEGGTKFTMTYAVTGYLAKGMSIWAGPADMMTSEQFTRLKRFVETGSAGESK